MGQSLSVLHIEDDFGDAMLLQHALYDAAVDNLNLEVVRTLRDARSKLAKKTYDLIVADLRLPDSVDPRGTVLNLLGTVPDTPILVLTGSIGVKLGELDGEVTLLDKNDFFHRRTNTKTQALVARLKDAILTRKAAMSADGDDALML